MTAVAAAAMVKPITEITFEGRVYNLRPLSLAEQREFNAWKSEQPPREVLHTENIIRMMYVIGRDQGMTEAIARGVFEMKLHEIASVLTSENPEKVRDLLLQL